MKGDDVHRKVGRGGAGSYYHATKPSNSAPKGAEAQELHNAVAAPPDVFALAPSRAGRGGAGNITDNSGRTRKREQAVADETAAAVKHQPPKAPTLPGRGGAGNWKGDTGAAKRAEEERGKGEELERKIREVVDQDLKMPEKAYYTVEKVRG